MRRIIIFLFFFSSCSDDEQVISIVAVNSSSNSGNAQIITPSYDSMKTCINNYRKDLAAETEKNYLLLEKRFVSVIVDSLLPYWYGTEWDFNGVTQTPRYGAIACGYFVSTVLRDAGITLNRVKVGRSASLIIVKTFANKKATRSFANMPLDSTLSFVKAQGPGLFVIGLDNHVGFIYNDGQHAWFIHSKWANPKAVVKEDAAQSGILYYSKYRVIGKISNNKILLDEWLNMKMR